MGKDVNMIWEGLPSPRAIKIHAQICSELLKLVIAVSEIFLEIESARPRCTPGIEALCLLTKGIAKAKSLLQDCCESSVLYLALTDNAVVLRCKKSRNILEQSLSELQKMVPILLAAKIDGVITDLRSATFCLLTPEEEAGKMLREFLHGYDSTAESFEESALFVIPTVFSLLHITSQKAIVIEKRSIRKLVDNYGESKPMKRKILLFFSNLLNKYGKHVNKEQRKHETAKLDEPCPSVNAYDLTNEVDLHVKYRSGESQISLFSESVPPEEFICPLTSRLMHDPVVIASGQTYERVWIKKWLDEGNETCPKTKLKLDNLSITANAAMKDLILRWCASHNMSVPGPKHQQASVKSWETSLTSIASLSSSMNDLDLPLDFISQASDPSNAQSTDCESLKAIDADFFDKFDSLPWDSRCSEIEVFKRAIRKKGASWSMLQVEKFFKLLTRFLKDSCDLNDAKAQISGCLVLLEFVQKDHRNSIPFMKEDIYGILASFIGTEVTKQALSVLEVLSFHKHCNQRIIGSGAVKGILNILNQQIQDLLEPALKILSNLSSNNFLGSIITSTDLIPKLIPHFEDHTLARYCVNILKNLCNIEDFRLSIAETDGCISAIAQVLENDSHDDQECALSILLSLCAQHVLFCHLVMQEGVIPGLVRVSINGNNNAKSMAMELLRILKDEFSNTADVGSESDVVITTDYPIDKNPPKSTGLFGKIFSKPSSFTFKRKRPNIGS